MIELDLKKFVGNFLKGIAVGIGGIAPGLSGSVMLIVLGLYEKVIKAIGNLFENFKKNVKFLVPIVMGAALGIILFSKGVDFMLKHFEFQTRYLFLGLVLGTVPMFYKEVKKRGFSSKYYLFILMGALVGFLLFSLNKNKFPTIEDPSFLQSVWLGVSVAGSSIVPGVDSAVILSALGLYELYVSSLAEFNLEILIPAGIGLAMGAVLISALMHLLIRRAYTVTFSIIFGLFLSIIPNVLNASCTINSPGKIIVACVLVVLGFCISFYLENIKENNKRIKKMLSKRK